MKTAINALVDQLKAYEDLSFAKDSGYASNDVGNLIQLNRFPFFNVTYAPAEESYEKFSNMAEEQLERHILPLMIQYATRSIRKEIAILGDDDTVGILDFTNYIWSAIKKDRTLGGAVSGILRPLSVSIVPVEVITGETIFAEGREMIVPFYRDAEA